MGKTSGERDYTFVNAFNVNLKSSGDLFPEEGGKTSSGDKILFGKEQVRVAVVSDKEKPEEKSNLMYLLIIALFKSLNTVIYIAIPVLVYKILSRVEKGVIFDRRNVKNLRILGSLFVGLALLDKVVATITYNQQVNLLNFENYTIQADPININFILIAMLVLLVGEIFMRGIRMKEEQDLTI